MRMSREKKFDAAMLDCYVELFANSTPPADFKELMANAPINERGQMNIDFMAYEIDEEKYNEIVESIIKKHKLKGYYKKVFKINIDWGCSPKFKRKENE